MRLAAVALVAACLASAALAQEIVEPAFDVEPSSAELVRHYPPQALAQNVSGIAVLCCAPQSDGSVACEVSSEWPEGQGFGAASVTASTVYRLTPQSLADLQTQPGARVRISMMWAGPVILPATVERLQRIDGETLDACVGP